LIWCTIDPRINPEARINHANTKLIVLECELWHGCGSQTSPWVRCDVAGRRAGRPDRFAKTGGRGRPPPGRDAA
jgi:hypothetical protein